MNLIFSPVYHAAGAVDDAETDVEAAKDVEFGSVKSMPLGGNYHVRVLIPCYKEPYEIVQRTVNAIRDAVLPAGDFSSMQHCRACHKVSHPLRGVVIIRGSSDCVILKSLNWCDWISAVLMQYGTSTAESWRCSQSVVLASNQQRVPTLRL